MWLCSPVNDMMVCLAAGVPVDHVYILLEEISYFRVTTGNQAGQTYLAEARYETAVGYEDIAQAEADYETINADPVAWGEQVRSCPQPLLTPCLQAECWR